MNEVDFDRHSCKVPDNLQVYVTGHKRPESLNNYRQLGNVHERQISSLMTSNSAIPQHGARQSLPPSSTVQSMPSFLPAPASGFPTSSPTPLISPPRNTSIVGMQSSQQIMSRQAQGSMQTPFSTATFQSTHPSETMCLQAVRFTVNFNVTANTVNNDGVHKCRMVRVIESDSVKF